MTKLPVRYLYWTKSKGINGKIKNPEDFIVNENIDDKFFIKFKRGPKIEKIDGKYSLCILKKKLLTTEDAINKIIGLLSISKDDISYAGLKDKFGITTQYITIKGNVKSIKKDNLELEFIKKTDSKISIGDLKTNEFKIKLHGCKFNKDFFKEIKYIPNYFGIQRFGVNKNNHIIGKLILDRKFNKALEFINKSYREKYRNIKYVDKKRLKFFIHAYQSWIFNELLISYIKEKKFFKGKLPLLGFHTKMTPRLKNITKINTKDFRIPELKMKIPGGLRKAFVKPKKINFLEYNNIVEVSFELPKGSYGTIFINELSKS